MNSRDEYLEKLKSKLDEWDKDIDRFEAKARDAQAEVGDQYHKQLETMREMRNEAMARYSEMQGAAVDAWESLAKATEQTWSTWLTAFEDARTKFIKNQKN
ncbi:MAG TPA: hypothetical protein DDY14_01245 [Chromatiaceae bacterium]|mgnify:CR=1 FL=1|jgi:uncharacterized protein YcbX|nr:MAG: hypothetical protein N838_09700 [Thiohalocapsa sp. PB-PSB1]QQO52791.1 MAG: hypothetical protein N838_04815 [Thiohalocapsa sp. PB-PSB1]HBG93958.1 hypothetical protein [Chromatiaceae bacterium]HCS91418.1 hypothetical protein [Chromatiaceae bacterium]